ncbi:MAG: hypothetical protein DHS20C15_16870 [Planctomycetota bacterium]|nr:MAG: hypothetical protein DHS20C15_16870 [Planctomycetota bacterium]
MNTERSPMSRVLIVEDNKVNQLVARRMVERLGYQTHVVDNGKLALDALSDNAYALVLMDCQMPVMDGYEATMEIRRREPPNQHLPIVALTAHVLDNNREQCLGVGMDDFVAKPVTNTQLKDVLDRWMQPPVDAS